jgi:splicing factor U2AF subunit
VPGLLDERSLRFQNTFLQAFVEYTDTEGSSKAKLALNGRKFAGNTVVAVYYPEDKFARGEMDG